MINFVQSRSIAFEWISKSETVRVLSLFEIRKLGLEDFVEVWEISTEVENAKEKGL